MHRFHPSASRQIPRSKLGSTLLRLHRCLEGSQHREQVALKVFEEWQSHWVKHRDLIARRLATLDQEICNLPATNSLLPQLLILNSEEAEMVEEEKPISVHINFPHRER